MSQRVNGLAEQIDGFVWRLQDDSGNAMNMRVYDDPRILPNLTLWENVEALERFVWQTVHSRFYGRREEWFEPIKTPLVLWWVPAGHRPSMAEGVERLEYLKAHGPSEMAFGWERLKRRAALEDRARHQDRGDRRGGRPRPRPACGGRGGIGKGQPVEPSHELRKQELAVQSLQVLVASGGRDRK